MECPNCGKFLDTSSGRDYVTCEYCRSNIAVLSYAEELISSIDLTEIAADKQKWIKNMLAMASIDMENRNYGDAYATYEKILVDQPFIWEAILNEAICVFWLGRQDMQHMPRVITLLQKADKISDRNALVQRAREDIAHNLAVLASKKERYGSNIKWSLDCFKISKKLVGHDKERDQLMGDYAVACNSDIFDRLQRNLERDKKSFDPPKSDVETLCELALLTEGKEEDVLRNAIMFTGYKLSRSGDKTDLGHYLDELKALHKANYRGKPTYQIHFPVFGSPKIVEGADR